MWWSGESLAKNSSDANKTNSDKSFTNATISLLAEIVTRFSSNLSKIYHHQQLKALRFLLARGVFRAQSNFYDGTFVIADSPRALEHE